MTKHVLVVAAHPDDEVLGCGGTLARHVDEGASVSVVFLTDGVGARGSATGAAAERRDAAVRAAAALGAGSPAFGEFPDNRLDSLPLLDVVNWLGSAVGGREPDLVYTHCDSDLNVDHRVAHRAALTLFRPLPQSRVRGLLAFEIPSSTEWAGRSDGRGFVPDRFVDITSTIERKMKAVDCYGGEMRPFPHSRSVEAVRALAAWRGASAGLKAAEAFQTIRWIER